MNLLIRGGHVMDEKNALDGVMDILVKDGVIAQIAPSITADCEVLDASGKTVCAGLIDMHVHLREPGFEYKEDIESGTHAAKNGGFTTVCCMPNTNPVCDNGEIVRAIIARADECGYCHVRPIGAITKGLKGQELSEMAELRESGAVAVSDDGRPVESGAMMKHALQYAAMYRLPVISHCEELSLLEGGVMNDSLTATNLGLKGATPAVEEAMIARDILIAEHEARPVHIAHVSTRTGVDLIRKAKARGVRVTCETCPHYFTLTDEAVRDFNTNAKMNPPLRSADDVAGIIEGLADGTIDCIVTDHAPHHQDEKLVPFEHAANGIVGLETSLPLGITYLVETGKLPLGTLLRKMTANPAEILGLDCGQLRVGAPADLTLFDAKARVRVDVASFASKGKNSPYDGWELQGKVHCTVLDGQVR